MGAATIAKDATERQPRLGEPAEFAAARRVFESYGYNYANVCARLGVERLYEYKNRPALELFAQPLEDALAVLVRMFTHGLHVERSVAERFLSPESLSALRALNLIKPDPDAPEMDLASVAIFPFPGALTASDRFCTPSGEPVPPADDAVYPALFANTVSFVLRLPQTPCEDLLDLGTGTGIAAIRHAPFAQRIWATDITARAVHFAQFNARLNGCENIQTLQGDLYAPVRGLTFDRIVTQPPYVAVETGTIAYRNGGKDGEQIFRRSVEELPEFLRPGGTCYALLMASDREGETFEQRIRKWLGAAAEEFDILVACDVVQEVGEFLRTVRNIPAAELEYRSALYQGNKTFAILYCSVVIRRKRAPGPAVSLRTFAGKGLRGEDLDFQLAWNAAAMAPGASEILWNMRPRLAAAGELVVSNRVRGGRFAPDSFELRTDGPFASRGKIPSWLATIVGECDGSLTWRERFHTLREAGRIPDVPPEEALRALVVLISNRVLQADEESFVFRGM